MPVVPEESLSVVCGIDVSLDRSISPWADPRGGGVALAPSKRGCSFMRRQTRKASSRGICGKAAVFDQLRNSETGMSSGLPSTRDWK